MERNKHFLNGFHLKIIGYISMIFDHIIVVLQVLGKLDSLPFFNIKTITIFRIIGRLSFIIFSYLTVEGILKSRNKIKYIARLAILSISMDLGFFLISKQYIQLLAILGQIV